MRINISEYVPSTEPLPTASSEEAANLRRLVSGKFPFLEYAVRYVLHHADAAVGYGVPQDNFVENFPLGEWISLDNLFERYQRRRHTPNASLLYIVAEENFPNLIQIELKRVPHMDIKGERYGFPILAALANKNKNAIKALLMPYDNAGPDNDMPHDQPSCSTARDREEATEYLLGNGRDICSRKELIKKQQTLLFWAVSEGAGAVVKALLATRKVDVNSKDKNGWTPLYTAAWHEHEAVVKILLAHADIDVNPKDKDGWTPLYKAAARGHAAVVQLLLARADVDVNLKTTHGWTPLYVAIVEGYEAVVGEHEAVVKLLLARADVDVNLKTTHGWTPLWAAVVGGYEAAVKLLLVRADVDINSKDEAGRTPLGVATGYRLEAVVKLLQSRGALS